MNWLPSAATVEMYNVISHVYVNAGKFEDPRLICQVKMRAHSPARWDFAIHNMIAT